MKNKYLISPYLIFVNCVIIVFLAWAMGLQSCQDDPLSDNPDIQLSFSLDTLRFDTVFTSAGSATRSFKIYNEQDEAVILDEIRLLDQSGFFRFNADGIQGPVARDLRIEARDSIYVFVEATIDPDQPLSISPFIIHEIIEVRANESQYEIHLEAWGQNANYFPNRESGGKLNYLSCNLGKLSWDDPRPYVIYGALIIDSCELVIPAGQKIYVHGGIAINELGIYNDGLLIFLSHGRLSSLGTASEPVVFSSDRLESEFARVPGQWRGIIFNAGSRNNLLQHTIIRNAISGLTVDSSSFARLEQCELSYTSGNGITAQHGSIYAQNCLFYENQGNSVEMSFGGSYIFNYCTFVNRFNQQTAISASNFKCTDPLCVEPILVNALYAEFNNCIIVGNERDEILLSDATGGSDPNSFAYLFNHSLISVDEILEEDAFPDFFDHCINCINVTGPDSLFVSLNEDDYRLDTMSLAIDKATHIPPIDFDILNNPREISMPDIGCYEFQK